MKIYNPGSAEAVKHGCTCDPETNHNGMGEPINDEKNRRYYITLYCPMHSDFKKEDTQ